MDNSRQDRGKLRPTPLQVEQSQYWDGVDGPWTSFIFQIGSGVQSNLVRLFPATTLPEVYLINPKGCTNSSNTTLIDGRPCGDSRGGIFNHNSSGDSYIPDSIYDLGANAAFKTYGFTKVPAQIGYDTFKFGWRQRDQNITKVEHTLLAEITAYSYTWLGMLGIDPRPTNLTASGQFLGSQETVLNKLKGASIIPSLSWAYTAGSCYFEGGSHGSLVLGGYDANRMVRNSIVFPFNDDVERVHTIWIENISLQLHGSTSEEEQLLGSNQSIKEIQSHIESNRPYIYLPPEICGQIANLLGLQYNQKLNLYLASNQTYLKLTTELQPNLTFSMTPINRNSNPVKPVNITLPYKSLIMKLDYPFANYSVPTWYVPIRQATDPKQYVLGRTFLQNAYLVSDYERKSFSLHEAKLEAPAGPTPLLRSISAQNLQINTLDSWKGHKNSFPRPIIIGTTIGCVVVIILITVIFACMWHKRRAKNPESRVQGDATPTQELSGNPARLEKGIDKPSHLYEADSGVVYESPDSATAHTGATIAGSEVPDTSVSLAPLEMPDTSITPSRSHDAFHNASSAMETSAVSSISPNMPSSIDGENKSSQPGPEKSQNTTNTPQNAENAVENNKLVVNQSTTLQPASPIPQTPLEYYDRSAKDKSISSNLRKD